MEERGVGYEALLKPARARFADHWAVAEILSPHIEPARLELFLVHFCSLGVHMTAAAARWMRAAAERCRALGMTEVAAILDTEAERRALRHDTVAQDALALVHRWNARRSPRLDPQRVLALPQTPAVARYRKLHDVVIDPPERGQDLPCQAPESTAEFWTFHRRSVCVRSHAAPVRARKYLSRGATLEGRSVSPFRTGLAG